MTYAGLTISDKPALLDAKEKGFKTTKPFHQSIEEWSIDLALAQIADMERIAGFEEMLTTGDETTKAALLPAYFATKANEQKPMTWNERINQMTVEEKAQFIQFKSREMYQKAMDYAWKFRKTGKLTSYYTERMIELLNSPYTEGATK